MQPESKLLRLLVVLVIGPTSLNGGEGSCQVDAYGWKRVGGWSLKCNEFLYLASPDASGMSAGT
jgi:hypothetical protein